MIKHISCVLKLCFLQLHEFRHIRSFILKSAALIFAHAFIHSHFNYCNSSFYDLSKYSLHRFQKLQNSVVCIVTCISHSSHITPILSSLHLLPVKYSINFQLCCITHHALFLSEPHYLNTLLIHKLNSHSRHSFSFNPHMLHFLTKCQMIFAPLHHFFETIYLTLFLMLLRNYLLEKPQNA